MLPATRYRLPSFATSPTDITQDSLLYGCKDNSPFFSSVEANPSGEQHAQGKIMLFRIQALRSSTSKWGSSRPTHYHIFSNLGYSLYLPFFIGNTSFYSIISSPWTFSSLQHHSVACSKGSVTSIAHTREYYSLLFTILPVSTTQLHLPLTSLSQSHSYRSQAPWA